MRLVTLLPASVREAVESRPDLSDMLEVVLDLGRPPIARFPAGDVRLSDAPVTAEDIEAAVGRVGAFGGDNRAGALMAGWLIDAAWCIDCFVCTGISR